MFKQSEICHRLVIASSAYVLVAYSAVFGKVYGTSYYYLATGQMLVWLGLLIAVTASQFKLRARGLGWLLSLKQ